MNGLAAVRVVAAALAAICVSSLACSQATAPAQLGDCVPTDDAACSGSGGGGGGSGGNEGGADGGGSCQSSPSDSKCDQCAFASCCAPVTKCFSSSDCTNLYSCVQSCGYATTCVNACRSKYSTVAYELDAVNTCLSQKCTICSQSGIGDPCGPAFATTCVTGLACMAGVCTETCTASTSCAGIGPNGGNFDGKPSACVSSGAGFLCAPGCTTSGDCVEFPGTFCLATKNISGNAVSVCAPQPDGG